MFSDHDNPSAAAAPHPQSERHKIQRQAKRKHAGGSQRDRSIR